MKLKKNIPLIDQHDRQGFWGGKFGGSFIPETLKKPIEDLTEEFHKLRKNREFIKINVEILNIITLVFMLNLGLKLKLNFFINLICLIMII